MSRSEEFDNGYRMQHQAPGPDAAPLHDLTGNGVYPEDVYTHPKFYSDFSPSYAVAHSIAKTVRGKPDATVTMYRAVPKGVQEFNTGDWVTIHADYAKQHGMDHHDPKKDMPVIAAEVPARHLHTNGDSLSEWGYNGPPVKGRQFR